MKTSGRWLLIAITVVLVLGVVSAQTLIKSCGGCNLWLDGDPSTLSVTGNCLEDCTSLNLFMKGIETITHDTFHGMPKLQTLYLHNNQIAEIHPDIFKNNTALQTLYLHNNQIAEIHPDTFKNNTALEMLFLHANQIAEIHLNTFKNNTGLRYLYLYSNQIAEIHPDTFKNNMALRDLYLYSNQIAEIHPDTFKKNTALVRLYLHSNQIAEIHPDTFKKNTALQRLEIFDNPLGCLFGVPDDVEIDQSAMNYGFYETLTCPSNCTTKTTYFDPNDHTCQTCPANTYTKGVGAVNCTAVTATTTILPMTTCGGDTRAFSVSDDTLCVPNNIYPSINVSHCVFENTWEDVIKNRQSFKTGGLGKYMSDGWEAWVCSVQHPCGLEQNDLVCFTYSENHSVFVPWGYNIALRVSKNQG